jgi:hypothetical protein
MTLLSGKFNSYYKTLGYHYPTGKEEAEVKEAASNLLTLTVGGWIKSPAAAGLEETVQTIKKRKTYDPDMKFYLLFQELHKRANGAAQDLDSNQVIYPPVVRREAKDLLRIIFSRIETISDKKLFIWRDMTKTFQYFFFLSDPNWTT